MREYFLKSLKGKYVSGFVYEIDYLLDEAVVESVFWVRNEKDAVKSKRNRDINVTF